MTNYEIIQSSSQERVAQLLSAMTIAILKKVADELNGIIGVETPLLPIENELEILNIYNEWLGETIE